MEEKIEAAFLKRLLKHEKEIEEIKEIIQLLGNVLLKEEKNEIKHNIQK
jgi:hypothetical protein